SLEATSQRIMADLGDHDLFLVENARFHNTVAEASGNMVLRSCQESLKTIADGVILGVHYSRNRHRAVVEAHNRIIEALTVGDVDMAGTSMSDHLEEAGLFWHRQYGPLVAKKVTWMP